MPLPDPLATVEHAETPSATVTHPTTANDHADSPATPNERYQLGREIARGGMGVVYRAIDTVFGREVAIKVLLNSLAVSSEPARRFHDEARITGQLQHPGIPPVHDLGVLPDGRPFLAMKLIQGQTLHDLLQQRSNIAHERGRFIAIFEQICQAVAYAHANGVIHRDLKPQNIMVGRFGEVQVMDWGLAKALTAPAKTNPSLIKPATLSQGLPEQTLDFPATETDSDQTQAGQAMGTPAYMPPEQARGDVGMVDRRADVFALGGVLCTILTGQAPYTKGTVAELLHQAATADVREAFRRLEECDADAELVDLCRRCLSAKPADRPRDAGAVADIVASYRAEVEQRLQVAERERAVSVANAIALRQKRRVQFALVASVSLFLIGGMAVAWWQDQQRRDRQATDLQRQLADEQQANAERERKSRNRDALVGVLERCELALRNDEPETATITLAEATKRQTENMVDDLASRVQRCQVDLAMLNELNRIDEFRWAPDHVAVPDAAVMAVEWQRAFRPYGVDPHSVSLANATARWQESLIRERLLAALELWLVHAPSLELAALLHAIDADTYRDALRTAWVARDSKQIMALAALDKAHQQPTRFTVALVSRAILTRERKRELLLQATARHPNNLAILLGLGLTFPINSKTWTAERLRWYQAAVAAHPHSVAALNNLGLALRDHGDFAGSIAVLREAIRLAPNNANAHNNLGNALRDHGQLTDAISAYQEATRCDANNVSAYTNLSIAFSDQKDYAQALRAVRTAIRLNPRYARAQLTLGMILHFQKDITGAIAAYREAIRLTPNDGMAHFNLGTALSDHHEDEPAILAFREAIRCDATNARYYYYLGRALAARNKVDDAIIAYREAVRLDPKYVAAHNDLGNAYRLKKQFTQALASYQETLRIDPAYAWGHYNIGLTQYDLKNYPATLTACREAVRLQPKHALSHNNLAIVLREMKDVAGSVSACKEAIRLDPSLAHAHMNLALAYAHQGHVALSLAASKEVVRLAPTQPDILNRAAWLFATGPDALRDGKRAVEFALRACELTQWKNADFIDTLAAAYAETGQFDKAVEMQKKALSFAEHDRTMSPQSLESLALYQQKKPFRDPALHQSKPPLPK